MPVSMHRRLCNHYILKLLYIYIYFFFCLFAFSGISLSGVKCQQATFGRPQRYWPVSKKRCLDIVSLQSSVKINQISLDESGEHVGICSEDGKVRYLCSSALVTDGLQQKKKKNSNQCFSSYIIHPLIHIKLSLSTLY